MPGTIRERLIRVADRHAADLAGTVTEKILLILVDAYAEQEPETHDEDGTDSTGATLRKGDRVRMSKEPTKKRCGSEASPGCSRHAGMKGTISSASTAVDRCTTVKWDNGSLLGVSLNHTHNLTLLHEPEPEPVDYRDSEGSHIGIGDDVLTHKGRRGVVESICADGIAKVAVEDDDGRGVSYGLTHCYTVVRPEPAPVLDAIRKLMAEHARRLVDGGVGSTFSGARFAKDVAAVLDRRDSQ